MTSPAPANGVIVLFRIRSLAAESVTFRLATVTQQGDTFLAQAAGTGPTVALQGTGQTEAFPARLPVQQGQHVALDAPSTNMVYNQGGNEYTPLYAPPLMDGQGPRGQSAEPTGELLVQAVLEPDADGDGFGDETQDGCPRQATTQGACDDAGPRVRRIAVGRRAIRYRLSEDATVTFRVQRPRRGRPGFVSLRGRIRADGDAGANRRALPRRFRAGRLPAGRYRLLVVARDRAGNETRTTKRFRRR